MSFFFFNDTATTEIYTLSLHDALPICHHAPLGRELDGVLQVEGRVALPLEGVGVGRGHGRSEEHTSELQSLRHLVCRLLLEKKKNEELEARDARYLLQTASHKQCKEQ